MIALQSCRWRVSVELAGPINVRTRSIVIFAVMTRAMDI